MRFHEEPDKMCVLCGYEKPDTRIFERDIYFFACPQCGMFEVDEYALVTLLPRLNDRDIARLRGVIRERYETLGSRDKTYVSENTIASLLSEAPESFDVAAKVRKLLRSLARRSSFPGDNVAVGQDSDRATAYAANIGEFIFLSNYAADRGWLEKAALDGESRRALRQDVSAANPPINRDWQYRLTPAGWEETRQQRRDESSKAFVAMWFDSQMTEAFESGIQPAIEVDCGYRAVKIDLEEHNDDIVDRVIAEINESRFLVADLTGHRNGVYFEAGYAKGLGIPVIWTCRKDQGFESHFDVEHFNRIEWETPSELRSKLNARIRATIRLGPLAREIKK